MNTQNTYKITWEEAVLWLRQQPQHRELVKACFYDDPLIYSAERYHQSHEWQEIKRYLPEKKGLACDIGAGRGISSYALARDGWQVVSLEPDKSNVVGVGAIQELSEQTGLPIQAFQSCGEAIPFIDETFDVVYARQVLHHACDLKQLCDEMARVLKIGGYFIVTREHVLSKPEDLSIFLQNHPLHRFYGGEHAYTLKEYVQAIKKSGIGITQILNPYESAINYYPMTKIQLKEAVAKNFHFPFPKLIPDAILAFIGSQNSTPGRLFSFIGRKQHGR